MAGKDSDYVSSTAGRHNAQNEQRLEAMLARAKAEILAGGHFHTAAHLAQLHGRKPSWLELSLMQAEANRETFSIEHHGQSLYPDYAFSGNEDGELLLPCLADVITVLGSTKDGWGMAFWFRSPNNFLGGKRPEDVLNHTPEKVSLAAYEEISSIRHG